MMEQLIDERNRIRNYLLGVPELAGNEDLEMRLLSDQDFLRQFSLVKDELMDDYVSGALSEDETEQFEKNFLSTPRRNLQVEVIRSLSHRAPQVKTSTESVITNPPHPVVHASTWSRYWPIAAFAVFVLGGAIVWIVTQSRHPFLTEQQQRLSAALEQLNDPRTVSSPQYIASITLKQVYVRGSEERRVSASNDKTVILVQLEIIGDTHESYRASLQTGEGVGLGAVQNLKPDTEDGVRVLRVKLPSNQLTSASYQIKLEGLTSSGKYEAIGLYPFQVVKNE